MPRSVALVLVELKSLITQPVQTKCNINLQSFMLR